MVTIVDLMQIWHILYVHYSALNEDMEQAFQVSNIYIWTNQAYICGVYLDILGYLGLQSTGGSIYLKKLKIDTRYLHSPLIHIKYIPIIPPYPMRIYLFCNILYFVKPSACPIVTIVVNQFPNFIQLETIQAMVG